ncbi:hypothetical protein [Planctomicrobium sp. SH527]|uniref:hypothetical protein n=1 Tax=Planctomicrobium sp. SH527 TaxID=3448123 RepID=UPI003F5BAF96
MNSSPEMSFAEFADRFVHNYWEDVVANNEDDDFTDSVEDCLATITFQTSQVNSPDRNAIFRLKMEDDMAAWWEFAFKLSHQKWTLISARSGAPKGYEVINWFDEVYGPEFRPFLDRVMQKSGGGY